MNQTLVCKQSRPVNSIQTSRGSFVASVEMLYDYCTPRHDEISLDGASPGEKRLRAFRVIAHPLMVRGL